MYKPSIQTFLFGMITGLVLGMLFMVPFNKLNMDISILSNRFITDSSLSSPLQIISDIGNHSDNDYHHLMINQSIANQLYNNVKILCWILTGPKNHQSKARHIKATWAKRCNSYVFMSTEEDASLPSVALPVKEDRNHLWGKTKASLKYAYDHYYKDYDWFFKADDDTYAIMENMRYLLQYYNSSDPIYFGYRFKPFTPQGYMSGGAGYVLSKEALRKFVTEALPNPDKCKQDDTGAEDAEIGKCLNNVGVQAGDSRDPAGRSRFLPLFITDFLVPESGPPDWFWKYSYYPFKKGMECCSDNLITIHYVNPHQLYLLDYLIYHVQPFGIGYNPVLENYNTNYTKQIQNEDNTISNKTNR